MRLRLTLEVTYNEHGVDPHVLANNLRDIIDNAYADGGFTHDTQAELTSHMVRVQQVTSGQEEEWLRLLHDTRPS